MTRREALQAFIALPIVAGCGTTLRTITAKQSANVLSFPASELDDSLLVRSQGSGHPIYVFREGKMLRAVLGECTHKGCDLNLEGSALVCPCHGSEFDKNGAVLNGPATKALRAFHIEESGNEIRIYLS